MKQVRPSLEPNAFNCPYCHAFAHQDWYAGGARHFARNVLMGGAFTAAGLGMRIAPGLIGTEDGSSCTAFGRVMFSRCANCQTVAIWVHDAIVYPQTGEHPAASPDMPDDIL